MNDYRFSLVIVTRNNKDILKKYLDSIYSNTTYPIEIWVVVNNTNDDTLLMLRNDYKEVRCITLGYNEHYGRALNTGLCLCHGEYVIVSNDDINIVTPKFFDSLYDYIKSQDIKCCSPQVLNKDLTLQRTCETLPFFTWAIYDILGLNYILPNNRQRRKKQYLGWHRNCNKQVGCISGCFMVIDKSILNRCGYFDSGIDFYFEEIDLCNRINRLCEIYYLPAFKIIHHGAVTTSKNKEYFDRLYFESLLYYFKKHHTKAEWQCLRLCMILRKILKFIKWRIYEKVRFGVW